MNAGISLFLSTFIIIFHIASPSKITINDDLCPQHIGPPCPRNFNNTMDDYNGQTISISSEMKQLLQKTIDEYSEKMYNGAPPSNMSDTDFTMFTGLGGRAFFFLRLYQNSNDADKKSLYLSRSLEYIERTLELVKEAQDSGQYDEKYVSFFEGKVGTYSVASMIYFYLGEDDLVSYYLDEVVQVFEKASYNDYLELDCGHAGLLYTGIMVNNFFGKEIVSEDLLLKVGNILVDIGIQNAESSGVSYMWWENPWFPDIIFPDSSHGISGILYLLFSIPPPSNATFSNSKVPQLLSNETVLYWVTSTLDYLVSTQFEDGNFPTPQQSPYPLLPDQLVQWDHGAPSYVSLMTQAGSIYMEINQTSSEKYFESAGRASDCMWERGLLTKGLMFCHGIGGNIYMFFEQYHFSKNETALWRALQFTDFALDPENVSNMRVPDTPYSMFQGSYAIAMLYSEFLVDDWKNQPSMPSWRPYL